MPIAYERDDSRRLITVTVTEPHSIEDVLGVIDRQMAEGTWGYAILYDLRSPMWIAADSQLIADHVKRVGAGRERGPVGIAVGASPEQFRRGLKYSELTRTIATVEVLLTTAQRDDWLARHSRPRKM